MMNVRFFNPGLIYQKHKEDFDEVISRVLTNGDLILRQDVEEFEKNLAEFVGTKYAVALNSGTDALYLALWALGIGEGDEVLVPSHTFVATAQVVNQLGAKPVLYDRTGITNIGEHVKAIIPAHIAGDFENDDMMYLLDLAERNGVFVVEDACQALGAVQGRRKAGTFGIAGAFSFYPAKILGAFGDAGGLVTDDEELYNKVKELRNHCKGDTSQWGVNSRMDNLQAAILNVRIKHLPEMLERRRQIAEKYLTELTGYVGLPKNTEGRVWQDFIITVDDRDNLYEFLKLRGVETMKNEYPMPLKKLPLAREYEEHSLRLPCNDVISDEEIDYVISQIKEFTK